MGYVCTYIDIKFDVVACRRLFVKKRPFVGQLLAYTVRSAVLPRGIGLQARRDMKDKAIEKLSSLSENRTICGLFEMGL